MRLPTQFSEEADFTLSTTLRGGYIFADQDNKDNFANFLYRGSVHDFTDTSAQGQLQYAKYKDFVPYLMIGLNVPTGHATIKYVDGDCCNGDNVWTGEQFSVSNTNTIEYLSSYGEGFNSQIGTGFSASLTKELSLSLGGAYTWRGGFQSTYATDLARGAYGSLGDQLALNTTLRYRSDLTQYSLGLGYSIDSDAKAVTINGVNTTFHHGDTIAMTASAKHDWSDSLTTDLVFNYSHILDSIFSRGGVSGTQQNFDRFQFEIGNDYQVNAPFSIYSKSSFSDTINPGVGFIDGLFLKGLNTYHVRSELGLKYQLPNDSTVKLGGGAFLEKVLETSERCGSRDRVVWQRFASLGVVDNEDAR